MPALRRTGGSCALIHAPAWGATASDRRTVYAGSLAQFRSTLPHGERRQAREQRGRASAVSIHAPAWGATCLRLSQVARQRHDHVSIHAPVRGATATPTAAAVVHADVSIHAPARGATTTAISAARSSANQFRSTLPHGERRLAQRQSAREAYDVSDPRSRMGSDCHVAVDIGRRSRTWPVSIHAPARGATEPALMSTGGKRSSVVSIHAPA